MVLAEIIIELREIQRRIRQLERYLSEMSTRDSQAADQATSKLLELLDKERSHLILLNNVNNKVTVTLGESEVSLANAITIAETIAKKVEILDELIDTPECSLDVFDLIERRDKIMKEYLHLSNGIASVEWSTTVD